MDHTPNRVAIATERVIADVNGVTTVIAEPGERISPAYLHLVPEDKVAGTDSAVTDAKKKAKKTTDDAKKKAKSLVEAAEEQAKTVADDAEAKAKALVEAAEEQACEILEAAQAQAQDIAGAGADGDQQVIPSNEGGE